MELGSIHWCLADNYVIGIERGLLFKMLYAIVSFFFHYYYFDSVKKKSS